MTSSKQFVSLDFKRYEPAAMLERARAFNADLQRRRSVRHFSDEAVPLDVIEECILAAGSAPSGAHRQPWTFVVVTDPELKRKIRVAAEEEEQRNYGGRMPDDWVDLLRPLGTDANKPHIEDAPALIVVFALRAPAPESGRRRNYYVTESVGIATGMLIAALHRAGLATLTHTPNPMNFLRDILERPKNESAFVLLPVGYPAEDCVVPDLTRKPLEDVSTWFGPR